MKWLLAVTLVGLAVAGPVHAAKQPPPGPKQAEVRLTVNPGEIARWRSPRIGAVERIYVRIGGEAAYYNPVPGTNRCVAYIYGQGVALRLTDCAKGRRVPYVRIRAVSAALKPVVARLKFN